MRVLVIDNHDSFTFNLVHLFGQVLGRLPAVVANDEVTLGDVERWAPDAVVISPGPGHPGRTRDFGVSSDVLRELTVPTLGVCLGHQGIGDVFGGQVRQAGEPVHGRSSRVFHHDAELFRGVPQGFSAIRYHSLVVDPDLPAELELTAWSADGVVMGLRHRDRPTWGLQFHPESIRTEFGLLLAENFLRLASSGRARGAWSSAPGRMPTASGSPTSIGAPRGAGQAQDGGAAPQRPRLGAGLVLHSNRLAAYRDPEDVFVGLLAGSGDAFWLDSSLVRAGESRFSYLGDASGPHAATITYDVTRRIVTVRRRDSVQHLDMTLFDFLDHELGQRLASAHDTGTREAATGGASPAEPITAEPRPADPGPQFAGGFVGYLGFELKADCGLPSAHRSRHADASLIFADRLLRFDHVSGVIDALALDGAAGVAARAWFADVERRLAQLGPAPEPTPVPVPVPVPVPNAGGITSSDFRLRRDEPGYLADIDACLELIRRGESYEICLTNAYEGPPLPRPLDLFRALRAANPAPYAAYLRNPELAVVSSSPERFLRVATDGLVTAKPIKGTAPRSEDPAEDARRRAELAGSTKNQSENLMIVDLLRNDLSRVCELGSVHVPRLMDVESYSTVHQLVSTVSGRLPAGTSAVDCLRAAFPGGSMTGAPKHRTLEILDALEGSARGVYSGCIGWFAADGSAELNIVIRTAVVDSERTTIGVGGAIVALSDPRQELEEMELKAAALLAAIDQLGGRD